MSKVYEYVTERILKELEKGEVPWRKPWDGLPPMNWKSEKHYRGINSFLLPGGEYVTFKQAKDAGGSVKKGEKGYMVVFYKTLEVNDRERAGEKTNLPYLRYYTVFEVSQCEGIERKRVKNPNANPIASAEEIVTGYKNAPVVLQEGDRASYSPAKDIVKMPYTETFEGMEEYYSTLFHELAHSTGHEKRLARKGIVESAGFGSDPYATEELIAEMTAAMLCGVAGIGSTIENSAAYIAGWRKRLSEDPRLIVKAASMAQKASDHILGVVNPLEEAES